MADAALCGCGCIIFVWLLFVLYKRGRSRKLLFVSKMLDVNVDEEH